MILSYNEFNRTFCDRRMHDWNNLLIKIKFGFDYNLFQTILI